MSKAVNPDEWCTERLVDPADDLYYAVLFSPHAQRDDVRAAAALFAELEATVTRFQDMHVARTKLAWWRDELERAHTGNAVHPVTRVLTGSGITGHAETALGDLITGMELILLEGPATDLATARMQAERGSARLTPLLEALFAPSQSPQTEIMQLGTAIGLARLLERDEIAPGQRGEIAHTASELLAAQRDTASAAVPPVGILAALAWRAAQNHPGQRRTDPGRLFTAWRGARRHMPRKMSKIGA